MVSKLITLLTAPTGLHVLLLMYFNLMVVHGYTPTDLLTSTIVSISNNNKASLSSVDNYMGMSLFNSMCTLFDNLI